jgi:hypothetical protein
MTTLVYPQLATGALSQFPVRKKRRARTVINRSADGSTVKLADPACEVTEWNLTYADLSDQEAATLQSFFAAAEGSLNGFTFLDPAGNLLAWSEQLDNEVWQTDPLLNLTAAVADPRGGARAWRIGNRGGAGQSIAQTVAAPGSCQYCLTAYLRADAATGVRMWIGASSRSQNVPTVWSRLVVPSMQDEEVTSIQCGIEVAALGTVEVYGVQLEAQPGSSGYKATSRGGVYENAHLRDDVLAITKTGVNRHSCTVNIIHANHL